jgi:predicted transcriptional regulator
VQEKDWINIMLIILEASNDASDGSNNNTIKGTAPNIIYSALFDDPRLKTCWEVLIHESLLSYDSRTHIFKPTEKGLSFLEAYKDMDYDRT